MAGLAASFGSGAMTNSVPEIEDARTIFIIGSNTTSSHPLVAERVYKAKKKGAKVIVADPRRIQISLIADIYIPLPPGYDNALINAMMHVIVKNNWHDREFIEERTEGFEEFAKNLEKYDPAYVERLTGIPQDLVVKAAEIYAKEKPSTILYCMGVTQHTTGTENVRNLANLAMLTGNVGKPSTGVNPLRGQNNVQGACDVGGLPNVLPAYQRVDNDQARKPFEEAWGVGLPSKPGLTIVEMMDAIVEGRIKALYIMGENPLISDPNLHHVEEALERLELLVVQDIFLTETGRYAHYILPGSSFLEKDGTFTNTDRRVQRVKKAIDPPGEAREDWRIIIDLAKAMGAKGFDFESPRDVFEEIRRVTPIYAGITYERMEKESIQWPCRGEDQPGTPYLHKDGFARGKGQFVPVALKEPAEKTDPDYPFVLTTGRVPFQFHTGTMTRRTELLESEAPEPFVEMHPKDAERIGVKTGDKVVVSSRRGSIEVKVVVTENIKEGVVFIPFHYREGAVNYLTNPALDPVAKIPEYKVCAVNIKRAGEG